MNIFDLLKTDHKKVTDLFEELLAHKDAEVRLKIFDQLKAELLLHTDAEEKTFYEALTSNDKTSKQITHAKEEHNEVKRLIIAIEKISIKNSEWLDTVKTLMQSVEHHVKEEENKLFALAKDSMNEEEIIAIGEEFSELKAELKTSVPESI
jgi:hemerythrin superfamily protein